MTVKNPRLIAQVSNEQLDKIKIISEKIGLSVASFVRLAVFEKLNSETEERKRKQNAI